MHKKKSTFGLGWDLLMAWFEKGNQGFLDTWEVHRAQTRGKASTYDSTIGWYAVSISMILSGLLIWAFQIPALIDHYSRTPTQFAHTPKTSILHSLPSSSTRHISPKAEFRIEEKLLEEDLKVDPDWETLMNRPAVPINQARITKRIYNQEFLSGYSGKVRLRVAVDNLGQYQTHYVLQTSHPKLQAAVESHVKRLVFRPAIKAGRTSAAWTIVEFQF